VQQLIEYDRFRAVAQALERRPVLGRDVFSRPTAESTPGEPVDSLRPLGIGDLLVALERVLARRASAIVHQVAPESLTLRDGLRLVVGYLRVSPRATFDELFPEDASRIRVIVTFLAVLELIRVGAITAAQGDTYGSIEISLLRDIEPDSVLDVYDELEAEEG
jgi:segregation and condensation protein A